MRYVTTVFALVAALSISTQLAHAAPPAMDVQHFQPQADRTGWFTTQSAQTLELWQPAFGLWLSYANQPLIRYIDSTVEDVIVRDLLTMDLQAAIGFGPVDVALDMPINLMVAGDGLEEWGTGLTGAAAGDLRVIPKIRFLDPVERGFGLGLALPVTMPTGNQDKYSGLQTVSFAPTLLLTGHLGKVRLGGNLGYRITGPSEFDDLVAGNAFLFRAAVGVQAHEVIEIGAELFGDVHSQARNNPTEWLAGVTLHPVPALGITLGGGTGIGPGFSAPAGRVMFGVGWAPVRAEKAEPEPEPEPEPVVIGDADGDGILDDIDKCVDQPEDVDKFEDKDGCPDPDNDGDGILDGQDRCPNKAEVVNNFEDEDGCPDEAKVKVEGKEIVILEKVYFDTNRSTIKKKSHSLLRDVAALLVKYPNLKRIEVQGHTDSVGADASNQTLSQARAEAVVTFLVGQGVDEARLVAKGYGESQLAVQGDSDDVHAQNRRVQFMILEQE